MRSEGAMVRATQREGELSRALRSKKDKQRDSRKDESDSEEAARRTIITCR